MTSATYDQGQDDQTGRFEFERFLECELTRRNMVLSKDQDVLLATYLALGGTIHKCLRTSILPKYEGGGFFDPNFVEHVVVPFSEDWTPVVAAKARLVRGFFLTCFSHFEGDLRRYVMSAVAKSGHNPALENRWRSLHELPRQFLLPTEAWTTLLGSKTWADLLVAQDISNVIRHGPGSSAIKLMAQLPGQYVHIQFAIDLAEPLRSELKTDPSQFLRVGSSEVSSLTKVSIRFWLDTFQLERDSLPALG